ncbi:MAG: hypothetical protein GXO48_05230 [Chlorobi bacterium]|nr:hypothetical protein [Chlorobiota bacterium]
MKRRALFLVLSIALLSGSYAFAGGNDKKKDKCCERKGIKALFHSKKKCEKHKAVNKGCGTKNSTKKKGCCAHKKSQ